MTRRWAKNIWGEGRIEIKHQAQDIVPQVVNQIEGLELDPNTQPSDLNDCFFVTHHGAVIRIGKDIKIGFGVMILATSHIAHPDRRDVGVIKDVVVGENVMIGSGAIILPGVTIGNNAVVAAGAVVTKDVPEDTVVAGVPAKVVGNVWEWDS